jgi:hypothetical protein
MSTVYINDQVRQSDGSEVQGDERSEFGQSGTYTHDSILRDRASAELNSHMLTVGQTLVV